MTTAISYNYSTQMQHEQHQSIKVYLIQQFLRLNIHCTLMVDAAILRRRNMKPEIVNVLERLKMVKVPVAPDYLTDDFFPWLIPLNLGLPDDVQILDESVRLALHEINPQKIKRGEGRLISGWLASNSSIDKIALHLGKSALQCNDGKNILLRYYDPAVAPLLWNVLDNWQQRRLLGPVTNWFSIDGDGQIIKRATIGQQVLQLSHSISLSPEEWESIKMIAIVNAILCEYRLTHINKSRLDELTVMKNVLPALRRAGEYSFQSKGDLIAYGMHALTISPEFDRHPHISRLLVSQRSKKNASYLNAVASVSESDWEKIRLGKN